MLLGSVGGGEELIPNFRIEIGGPQDLSGRRPNHILIGIGNTEPGWPKVDINDDLNRIADDRLPVGRRAQKGLPRHLIVIELRRRSQNNPQSRLLRSPNASRRLPQWTQPILASPCPEPLCLLACCQTTGGSILRRDDHKGAIRWIQQLQLSLPGLLNLRPLAPRNDQQRNSKDE